MASPADLGPLRLIRRFFDARRGDPRAKEDLYHLRGVLTFVALFAATIGLPGLLLAYYGIAGIRAQQDAARAQVANDAELAADLLGTQIEAEFKAFEDSALGRLTTGKSMHARLGELSPALRVVYRFDEEGQLAAPVLVAERRGVDEAPWRMAEAWRRAADLEQGGEYGAAATLWGRIQHRVGDPVARGDALFARARCLLRAGDVRGAEAAFGELAREHRQVRTVEGFRLGDLARFKLAEILLAREPDQGVAAFQRLIADLLGEAWTVGEGGEAAVVQRALDNLEATGTPQELVRRDRDTVDDRQAQLYWAGVLQAEMDSLGAKGRLLRQPTGKFYYTATDSAVWARTWTETDQYLFALDADLLLKRLRGLGEGALGVNSDVVVTLLAVEDPSPPDVRVRRPLSRAPQWSIVAYPRDPAALDRRQSEDVRRSLGIVLLSVVMIVIGAFLSAGLVRRELDAARLKSEFAANVSHELRSPITQIRLKAEALQLGLAETPESQARHYDVIVREAERLSRMVDNMLDFAAIERGQKKYNLRPGDLAATVQNVVESARVAMEMRVMQVEESYPEDLPPVWHDPDAIAQVIVNLLSNAAKYGQDAGWIGVVIRSAPGEVLVEVSDRGIGIDAAETQAIFEQYYRSNDPNARRRKGTGIGLTIVKYIMEAHGGRVTVHSTLGVGTTFVLHFPIQRPASLDRQGA